MPIENIPYKSFCWAFGTTSFRTKNFNQRIELQLSLLNEFWSKPENKDEIWTGNSQIQEKYYDFMHTKVFLVGNADNKPKDAREKTSGLVDIGLITQGRKLTDVGQALLEISISGDFSGTNDFQIAKDSYIYLKQLLKTSYSFDSTAVRPFIILLYILSKVDYLTLDEYTYLLPLCTNKNMTEHMPDIIRSVRQGTTKIDDIILDTLMNMDNYQKAFDLLLSNTVTEDLICTIGLNRKSRNYDKPYLQLWESLKDVYLYKNTDKVYDLYLATKQIKIGLHWRNLLFNTSSKTAIKNNPQLHLRINEFTDITDEAELKKQFFNKMHLFKAKATLSDYLDLNRRYIKNTDIVLFDDGLIKLDIIPKQFFNSVMSELYEYSFMESQLLSKNCDMVEIAPCLTVNEREIINGINNELGTMVTTMQEARQVVEDERYRRLQHLIDTKFTDENLVRLLDLFEERDDDTINLLVTDNADIPTIFEYILGIIWYKASDRRGKLLEYMKLSLEADLLPKTHAGGGEADIVYEYDETEFYPKHSLLIEATLANANNQRSMEMEPVSRHLGQHLLRTGNMSSYCVFATNYLNINVISDFRSRKTTPWYDVNDYSRSIDGMKIIPLQTNELKGIVRNNIKYSAMYSVFEEAFNSTLPAPRWYEEYIANKIM